MSAIYKNRTIINQRAASIDIDNTTNNENIQISHRSGSNINLSNETTSELATNNKQTKVINDNFHTVNRNSVEFVGKDKTDRIGENHYILKGFTNQTELDAFNQWKDAFRPIALNNSQFKLNRGGYSYPNGVETPQKGSRSSNPVLNSRATSVENSFSGYINTPIVDSKRNEVTNYTPVAVRQGSSATQHSVGSLLIDKSAGPAGSNAPGVITVGSTKSAATENGSWAVNTASTTIASQLEQIQPTLLPIEQSMGNGGDDIFFVKKNKVSTIGAAFNDFPSIRIDEDGRSQPFEMLVSDVGAYKNHDTVPVIEEVDNSSMFPCGEETAVVGNRYNLLVGSGGVNLKTTGGIELGGTILKTGFKKIHLNASHGVHVMSESVVELTSLKSIVLRTPRQVFVEGSLGVNNDLIVGGGAYIEGETYVQHITAPVEIQQTEDTILCGKFKTNTDRTLAIGEVKIEGYWHTVYALAKQDLIISPPHSHHFKNIPLRLTKSNSDVRKFAQSEGVNNHIAVSNALPQTHARKTADVAS
jgi:hypothetical protein